jgi:hypothetical protein
MTPGDRRMQGDAGDCRDDGISLDAITDPGGCLEMARHGRIDETVAPDPADRPRLALKRQRRACFNNSPEAVAPARLNCEIDILTGDEIRAEPDRQWRKTALFSGTARLRMPAGHASRPTSRSSRAHYARARQWGSCLVGGH